MDCLSQFKLGYYFVVQTIHGRRYPLVDSERGVVWAHAVFDQGTVNEGTLSDGRKYTFEASIGPAAFWSPRRFSSRNGKIRRVEMIGPAAEYHMNSPWAGRSERELKRGLTPLRFCNHDPATPGTAGRFGWFDGRRLDDSIEPARG